MRPRATLISTQAVARRARVCVLAFVLVLTAFAASRAAADAEVECSDVRVPVALEEGSPKSYSVYGLLCEPGSTLADTIQISVSGATEGGPAYWDFPDPEYYRADPSVYRPLRARYSYVNYLTRAGYASLTLDRIGTGRSSHPGAIEVDMRSNAHILHQVAQALRTGSLEPSRGIPYRRVIGVGRSLGAAILFVAAVEYPGDLDGLIIQSYRRHQQVPFLEFPTTWVPAQAEPRFADLPLGYYTTRAGTRRDRLFYLPRSESAVIEHEERTKETVTTGEVATFPPSFDYTLEVELPMLSIVGEYDRFFCTDTGGCPEAHQEAGFFPKAVALGCFESQVIPDAGHHMNLQTNSKANVFPVMKDWLDRNFAPGHLPCQQP